MHRPRPGDDLFFRWWIELNSTRKAHYIVWQADFCDLSIFFKLLERKAINLHQHKCLPLPLLHLLEDWNIQSRAVSLMRKCGFSLCRVDFTNRADGKP